MNLHRGTGPEVRIHIAGIGPVQVGLPIVPVPVRVRDVVGSGFDAIYLKPPRGRNRVGRIGLRLSAKAERRRRFVRVI